MNFLTYKLQSQIIGCLTTIVFVFENTLAAEIIGLSSSMVLEGFEEGLRKGLSSFLFPKEKGAQIA